MEIALLKNKDCGTHMTLESQKKGTDSFRQSITPLPKF